MPNRLPINSRPAGWRQLNTKPAPPRHRRKIEPGMTFVCVVETPAERRRRIAAGRDAGTLCTVIEVGADHVKVAFGDYSETTTHGVDYSFGWVQPTDLHDAEPRHCVGCGDTFYSEFPNKSCCDYCGDHVAPEQYDDGLEFPEHFDW